MYFDLNSDKYYNETSYYVYEDIWKKNWFNYVLKNREKNWDFNELSANDNVTWELVENNYDIDWNFSYLSSNKNINLKIVQDNIEEDWDWDILSENENITMKDIKDNPTYEWNWNGISINPNIDYKTVIENFDKINFENLSMNSYISLDMIKKLEKFLDFDHISTNPNITWEYVESTLNTNDWNFYYLSSNKIVTLDIIKKFPSLEWNKSNLLENPNITSYQMILDNKDILNIDTKNDVWKFYYTYNTNFSWKDYKDMKYACFPYYFTNSMNEDLEILENEIIPQKFYGDDINKNPNLTWDFIEKNSEVDWNYSILSSNNFEKSREKYIKKMQGYLKEYQNNIKNNIYYELQEVLLNPCNYEYFKELKL